MIRAITYSICAVIPAYTSIVVIFYDVLRLFPDYKAFALPQIFTLVFWLGSLFPPILVSMLHMSGVPERLLVVAEYVALYAMVFLVIRRTWLFFAKHERVPASFRNFPQSLGYLGVISLLLEIVHQLLGIALRTNSFLIPSGTFLYPAMVCIPWSFFFTEVFSLARQPRNQHA